MKMMRAAILLVVYSLTLMVTPLSARQLFGQGSETSENEVVHGASIFEHRGTPAVKVSVTVDKRCARSSSVLPQIAFVGSLPTLSVSTLIYPKYLLHCVFRL